jgi:HEPN domain-containing protein
VTSMTSIRLAEAFLDRARTRLKALDALRAEADFSDVVREARDIVDLCIRGMLRVMDIEVSRWREAGEILQENIRRFPSEIVAHEERLMGILKDLAQANEIPPSDEDHVPHAVVEKMNIGDADRATAEAEWVLGIAEMTISVVGHRAPAASAR